MLTTCGARLLILLRMLHWKSGSAKVSKGSSRSRRDVWWYEEVHENVGAKHVAYANLMDSNIEEEKETNRA